MPLATRCVFSVAFGALLVVGVVACERGVDPAPYPECVPDKGQFTCYGESTTWRECASNEYQGTSCKADATPCMGCNKSVGGFTCGCRDDAAADAGPRWQCVGTQRTCRSSDGT